MDSEAWADGARALAVPILCAAALQAAADLDTDLGVDSPEEKGLVKGALIVAVLAAIANNGKPPKPPAGQPDDTELPPADESHLARDAVIVAAIAASAEMVAQTVGAYADVLARTVALHAANARATVDSIRGVITGLTDNLKDRMRTTATGAVLSTHEQVQQQRATAIDRWLGKRSNKTWITRQDSRVRPAHGAAQGQTVAFDKPFKVGGESLMFPKDPVGSPENIYNCRCRVKYSPKTS